MPRIILAFALFCLILSQANAQDDAVEDRVLVERIRTTWHAQDGETVDQIVAKASKVAHFVSRGWEVAKTDAGEKTVVLSWAKHRKDKADDEYTISWKIGPNGAMTIEEPYAKPMELGWQAFALSLIDSEVSDEEKQPNLRFLHDPSNFDFVVTPQGKLGDLLRRGRCLISDDHLSYLPKVDGKPDVSEAWHIELYVNCDISGPKYFTRGGIIHLQKHGINDWQPASFFARRIFANAPGHWFDHPDAQEQETFKMGREVFERAGLPVGRSPFPK